MVGYPKGGIEAWYNAGFPFKGLGLTSVFELNEKLRCEEPMTILDVRSQAEWDSGHIEGSAHIFVGYLEQRLNEIPTDKLVMVLCSVGRRTSLAASILQRAGFEQVSNVLGGMTAWLAAGFPVAS